MLTTGIFKWRVGTGCRVSIWQGGPEAGAREALFSRRGGGDLSPGSVVNYLGTLDRGGIGGARVFEGVLIVAGGLVVPDTD